MKKPVLFLIFNRPDTTNKVFEAIREYKPEKLFIAADGPRNKDEAAVCEEVRGITKKVDWECEVRTLFRDTNLGCRNAVSSAIDWFFESVEDGIILEDDCLPNQSLFRFCEEMLDRYKDDLRVWHVSGSNLLNNNEKHNSYYFSRYGSIWGWATWRNRWEKYDVDMKSYEKIKDQNIKLFENKTESEQKHKNFERIIDGFNTWDFQWTYAKIINNGLNIVPYKNLISNIGFGENATHTKGDNSYNTEKEELSFPIQHPDFIIRNIEKDIALIEKNKPGFINKILTLYKKIV